VMESILSRGTEDILEVDIGSDSHRDEDGGTIDWPRGLPKVISMAQQQLVGMEVVDFQIFHGIRGIQLVGSLLHLMMVQVAPTSDILHSWIFMRGLVGIHSIWQDKFSLLILRIEYGDGFVDFGSTGIPLQVQLLDSGPSPYMYFSMRILEWGKTFMTRVVQRQRDGPFLRLAWDLGIAELGISLTDGGEWILARGKSF
jgi:hypothetical protein